MFIDDEEKKIINDAISKISRECREALNTMCNAVRHHRINNSSEKAEELKLRIEGYLLCLADLKMITDREHYALLKYYDVLKLH